MEQPNQICRPLLVDLRTAVAMRPKDSAAVESLASALHARGEFAHAARLYRRAICLDPGRAVPYRHLSKCLLAMGQQEEAVSVLREAVLIDSKSADAVRDLATILLDLGRSDEAKQLFMRAAREMQDFSSATWLCTCCLPGRPWRATAHEVAELAGFIHEELLYGYVGRALLNQGRLDEAKDCFEAAMDRGSDKAVLLRGLGDVAYVERDLEQALRYHNAARAVAPQDVDVTMACIADYIASGQLKDARDIFRSTRHAISSRLGHECNHSACAPLWDGCSLKGKTLLLHGPVGIGDTLQHCRFLDLIKGDGGTGVLEVQHSLKPLILSLSSADSVVCKFDALPSVRIDYECNLREVFFLRDLPLTVIGLAVPYIFPLLSVRRRFARIVIAPNCLKIGIVWDGGKLLRSGPLTRRSVPLDSLRPLTQIPNCRLFSLQVGLASNELLAKSWASEIINLAPHIHDLVDTAAIISLLDIIVSIDTSVAHLAGAMGKRTFLMLPYWASPRWQIASQNSAWYPTIRVFRTQEPCRWDGVVAMVEDAIIEACNCM